MPSWDPDKGLQGRLQCFKYPGFSWHRILVLLNLAPAAAFPPRILQSLVAEGAGILGPMPQILVSKT